MTFKKIYENFDMFKTKINQYQPNLVLSTDILFFKFLYDRYGVYEFAFREESEATTETFSKFHKFKTNYIRLLDINKIEVKELIISSVERTTETETTDEVLGGSQNLDESIDLTKPIDRHNAGVEGIVKNFMKNGGSDKVLPSIISSISTLKNFPNVYDLLIKDFNNLFVLITTKNNKQFEIPDRIETVEIETSEPLTEGGENQNLVNKNFFLKLEQLKTNPDLTGPQGPPGSLGPAGLPGPTGLPGPKGENLTAVWDISKDEYFFYEGNFLYLKKYNQWKFVYLIKERATRYIRFWEPSPENTTRMKNLLLNGTLKPIGVKNATGPAGPKGDKGDKGDKGSTGLRGPRGNDGVAGLDGRNFIDSNVSEDGNTKTLTIHESGENVAVSDSDFIKIYKNIIHSNLSFMNLKSEKIIFDTNDIFLNSNNEVNVVGKRGINLNTTGNHSNFLLNTTGNHSNFLLNTTGEQGNIKLKTTGLQGDIILETTGDRGDVELNTSGKLSYIYWKTTGDNSKILLNTTGNHSSIELKTTNPNSPISIKAPISSSESSKYVGFYIYKGDLYVILKDSNGNQQEKRLYMYSGGVRSVENFKGESFQRKRVKYLMIEE